MRNLHKHIIGYQLKGRLLMQEDIAQKDIAEEDMVVIFEFCPICGEMLEIDKESFIIIGCSDYLGFPLMRIKNENL